MKEYKLLINGEWTDSSTNETFENINQATLEKRATFQVASEADVNRAVEPARNAFKEWSETPPLVMTREKADIGHDSFKAALKKAVS